MPDYAKEFAAIWVRTGAFDDVHQVALISRFILEPLERGGHRYQVKSAAIIKERISRWSGDEQFPSTDDQTSHRRQPRAQQSAAAALRGVLQTVRDCNLSKARKLLLSSDLLAVEDAAVGLRSLHPEGNPVSFNRDGVRGSFGFATAELEAAIRSFPVGSSGGPSGLLPRHLHEQLLYTQAGTL